MWPFQNPSYLIVKFRGCQTFVGNKIDYRWSCNKMHLLHVIKSDSKESLNDFICNILKKFWKVSKLDETGNEHYLNAIYPSYNSFCV